MPRVKLEIPSTLPFETVIPIRITDLNYGAHLGNDTLLSLVHEARVQFVASKGFTEMDAGGASFIMADCAIVYKAEGFYGQKLRVQVGAGDFSRAGFDIYYRILIEGENKILAEAKTGIVTYDYKERKIVPVPEILKQRLEEST
jgi:acyl-CoA thioesterase FadM